MTYRDILVQMDGSEAASSRALAAARLAARSGAVLSGVFLASDFMRNYWSAEAAAYLPPDTLTNLLKEHARGVARAADQARAIFDAAAGEAGVTSDWRVIDGDWDDPLIAFSRRVDLVVFPATATASHGVHRISAADVGLASGGPVLVTPTGPFDAEVGRRVLVAWKGARESARALRDAWPLIARADEVHVLKIAPEGDDGADGLLQRHLEHHGCRGDIIIERSPDASAAECLRRHVAGLGADLLVMGLYGRPRMAEQVLGGVSSDLLGEPPCALLVSH
jgi:nucleotide-binding universal stress UspA family protein